MFLINIQNYVNKINLRSMCPDKAHGHKVRILNGENIQIYFTTSIFRDNKIFDFFINNFKIEILWYGLVEVKSGGTVWRSQYLNDLFLLCDQAESEK